MGADGGLILDEAGKVRATYARAVAEAWNADPLLTVTEWAEEHIYLPSKGAAEPGRYRVERTPYMREIMDAMSVTSAVEEVALMAAAQTGKSQGLNNWAGYVIDNAPGPMLLVQPTVDNAKRYSKQRITPMISESPRLAAKIVENKSRDAGNTILEKEYPGGMLLLGGANSAAGLRSMPIRYLGADEISNWPADVDGEGDPLIMAEERTNSFGRKKKIFKCSTPGIKNLCRIEAEFLKTDQRRYYVPCPHCGHLHTLAWSNFVIPKDADGKKRPKEAHMVCPSCAGRIEEHHKTEMLAEAGRGGRAEWRATAPENADPTRRGYHINALYSPIGWKSWAKIARQWIEAQGNPRKLQGFVNNVLAETWEIKGEKVAGNELQRRAESAGLIIRRSDAGVLLPPEVLLISIGGDVQPDRIELEVVGWGLGEESWSLDYRVLYGDPNAPLIWQDLDLFLGTDYVHPTGVVLRSARTFIDTGGANTKAVYDYVRPRAGMGVFGIKGVPGDGKPAVGKPTGNNIGQVQLFPLGTFTLKDTVYGRLRIEAPGPGFCHFPASRPKEYFDGLTAEEVKTKYTKGFPVREWVKIRERNEPLDCRAYATAAMISLNANFEQLAQIMDGSFVAEDRGRRVRSTGLADAEA